MRIVEKIGTVIGGCVVALVGAIVCLGLLWVVAAMWHAVFG